MSPASRRLEFKLSSDDVATLEDCRHDDAPKEEERVNFDLRANDLNFIGSRLPTPFEIPS